MNTVHNYTGTKICETCLNHAITSYVFVNKIRFIRARLYKCISHILCDLNNIVEPETSIMVEIPEYTILPAIEMDIADEDITLDSNDEIDESKLKIDVLEDEFRIESETSESDNEQDTIEINVSADSNWTELKETNMNIDHDLENPAKNVTKTYVNRKLVNGYQQNFTLNNNKLEVKRENNVCSEFLTFKKQPKPKRRLYKWKFTCPLCSKHFISEYFFKKHVLKHVNFSVECHICNNRFKSKFYLFEHIKVAHLMEDGDYSDCRVCGRTFNDKKKMRSHQRTHVDMECLLCNKVFASQKFYDSHVQKHAVKFSVHKHHRMVQNCSFCEKECSDENELSLHVNKEHLQIKPYNCDMCDKRFYTEHSLSCHKKVHSLLSKEICQFCNKKFNCRKDLVVHVRKHIGVKPYTCHVCPQSFYSDTKLYCHMRKSHGGRFYCRLCKSIFNRKHDLKVHVNVAHNAM